MRKVLGFLLFLGCYLSVPAQTIQTPSEFFGYKTGDHFTPYHRVVDYCNYLASISGNIRIQQYGRTYEGRPLMLAFVGSAKNINSLEQIRHNNLRLAGLEAGASRPGQPAVVWLSYNVHGNEAVSTEAALLTLFDLVDPRNIQTRKWLENTIVIIDPCMNPDGRERYVSFYNSSKNIIPDPLPFTREHREPWPGGRTNHYYFDLNRDWAWQTQKETRQRMEVYGSWLPQVHVDFHEQGINAPYYFAPAAEPFHQDISEWQREFQTTIGRHNARYFDQKGWLYFTRERFDLLYPSYGDTYPTYNGSVGMTFEQGGAGKAGLVVLTRDGDTLTLASRISHHHLTGLATIEAVSANAAKVVSEFSEYFRRSKSEPRGIYKSYVIRGDNPEKIRVLTDLLTRNGITYGFGAAKAARGLNYLSGKNERFQVNSNDLVISAYQPKSVLLKVLFEPHTFISDSLTYDITAWALPYAYGLSAYATREVLQPLSASFPPAQPSLLKGDRPVAFAANWNSASDAKFLADLLKKDVKVRYSEVPFEIGGKAFGAGSLLITRAGNERFGAGFDSTVIAVAKKNSALLQPMASGFVEKGADLGSGRIHSIKRPRVAVVYGEGVSSQAMGEVWHFFEQQLEYPLSVLRREDLAEINLDVFNVLILPDGAYPDLPSERLLNWVNAGGKLIAMESAVMQLSGRKGFDIKLKDDSANLGKDEMGELPADLKPYGGRERELLKSNIPGAVFRVDLDNSHPLGFGFPGYYYTIKLDDKLYRFLSTGWNVGILKSDNYVAGFVGTRTRKKLMDGLLFGVQESGEGSVVYLADDPLFRSFWENGKLLFSNAVFMVGQ